MNRVPYPTLPIRVLTCRPSYRAPAIYGYATNKVGEADFGTAYNEQFASTVWSIVAPYDEALCHESRVILRSETLQSESVLTHTASQPTSGHPTTLMLVTGCKWQN